LDEEDLWMFMGDFNFYRYAENRNRSGGNFNDSLVFNNIISLWVLLRSQSKAGASHGAICNQASFWSNLTGFSPPPRGLLSSFDNGASFSQDHL
jgi:hypothetical protein